MNHMNSAYGSRMGTIFIVSMDDKDQPSRFIHLNTSDDSTDSLICFDLVSNMKQLRRLDEYDDDHLFTQKENTECSPSYSGNNGCLQPY